MTACRRELESRLAEFLGLLRARGLAVGEVSYHDFQARFRLAGVPGHFSLWYSPKRSAYTLKAGDDVPAEAAGRVLRLWEELEAGRFAATADLSGWHLFCDGSWREGRPAWAFCLVRDGRVVARESGSCAEGADPSLRNVAAEMEAVLRGLARAKALGATAVTVHHDYEGLAAWPEGRWKTNKPATRAYAEAVRSSGLDISWTKVAAHTGHHFNELVDRLAAEAASAGGGS